MLPALPQSRTRVQIRPFGPLGYRFVCECGATGPPLSTSRHAYLLWEEHRLFCPKAPPGRLTWRRRAPGSP